jgi:hypothetical protein
MKHYVIMKFAVPSCIGIQFVYAELGIPTTSYTRNSTAAHGNAGADIVVSSL